MKDVQKKVIEWAEQKGIFEHGNRHTQFEKLKEEVNELADAVNDQIKNEIELEFGDVLVVLTILAKQLETDFETCLGMAYDKIKNRTGRMENGTFVKD